MTLNNNTIQEFPLLWKKVVRANNLPPCDCAKNCVGSTHELIITDDFVFVTGQSMYQVAKFNHQGEKLADYVMPHCSGPHGLQVDNDGALWVSLEFLGFVVRLDKGGNIDKAIDVNMYPNGNKIAINPAPHCICFDPSTGIMWFTGKRTSTIGKINPDGSVEHFELKSLGATPIYLSVGPDGNIWGTELTSSKILKINTQIVKTEEKKAGCCCSTATDEVTNKALKRIADKQQADIIDEYTIPTANARPIAIIPDPSQRMMWFTEEAGKKVGRIEIDVLDPETGAPKITEFAVPVLQPNDVLASLAFDCNNNLWVEVYVDQNNPNPEGKDYIVQFDASIRDTNNTGTLQIPFTLHEVPTPKTVMHRIRADKSGKALWFTELNTDQLGKITIG